jgi:tetratricopeptide (TPR) repeat protein
MRRNSGAEYWEQANVASGGVNSAVQQLAREVLGKDRPELMGRSHLQWAITSDHPLQRIWHYEQALQVFRQWALREPTNPLPYYYMAVTYHYYGDHGHESSEMAGWSEDTLHDKELWEKGWLQSARDWFAAYRHGPGKSNEAESYAEGLEASAEILMEKSKPLDDSADLAAYLTQRQEALDHLNRAEALLARLDAKGAPDADTEENLAAAKSLRADVLMADMPSVKGQQPASLGDLRRAFRDEQDAIAIMTEILRQEPDSAGFHMNLATMYLRAGDLAGKLEQQGQSSAASETPAACYRLAATEAEQALHLYPRLSGGLSLASDALSSLEQASPPEGDAARHERLRLCQTMALILPQMRQPESCPALPETLMENVAAVPLTPQAQPTKAPQALQPKVSRPQAPPPVAREAARSSKSRVTVGCAAIVK